MSSMNVGARQLSLRLWAGPHCQRISRCILLEHHCDSAGARRLILAIDARGVVAVVTEEAEPAPPIGIGLVSTDAPHADGAVEPWPELRLVRLAGGSAQWQSWPMGAAFGRPISEADAARAAASAGRPLLTEAGRRAVVRAIEAYHLQHVLEPSVAGFLSILEKQFARADLYLCVRALFPSPTPFFSAIPSAVGRESRGQACMCAHAP